MKISREKIIGLVVIMIAFFSITGALSVEASFWKDMFAVGDSNKEKSIFDISGLDSDSDKLSDKEEYDLGTNPYSSDSDEDGYTDYEEIKAGFDPLKQEGNNLIDKDGDGLTGEDERKYGTNPDKADSDYDGYSDGFEVIAGHNPLEADFSFLEPVIAKTENIIAESEENCEGEDCPEITNKSPVSSSTPDSIEKLLNVKNFTEVSPDSLSSIGLDASKMSLDKTIDLPDIADYQVKISDDVSKENIQIYFNIIGIALYSNSPVHSIEEAESYAASVNITNPAEVQAMREAVANIRIEFGKTEVPNDEGLINFHKKTMGAAITLESLLHSLEEINSGNKDSFYTLVNLLPKFSGLNEVIFDDIYPEAKRLAEEKGVSLPDRAFLEQYK